MRVYIAGSFGRADFLAGHIVPILSGHQLEVTSSWLREGEEQHTNHTDEVPDWQKRARAHDDMVDINRSDVMLVFTDVASTTGGFHFEVGYAIASGIPVYMVGPRLNVFHYDQRIQHCTDAYDAAIRISEEV
jgi:nucleoside 2-deoxyribosyltransferase